MVEQSISYYFDGLVKLYFIQKNAQRIAQYNIL